VCQTRTREGFVRIIPSIAEINGNAVVGSTNTTSSSSSVILILGITTWSDIILKGEV
jgi:hypothetical protein